MELEERISNLETIVRRLSRRSRKHASAIVTPYPISNCVIGENIKGDVLKYMFCAKGLISKGLLVFGKKPKVGVKVKIDISNDIGGSSRTYVVTRKSTLVEPNIEVFSSDRLTISVDPVDEEDKVTEVWMSFLWIPSVEETDVKRVLISSLDKELDELYNLRKGAENA